MSTQWLRRAWALAAACTASVLLAACGGGDIESQLNPTRLVAFGDGFADLGQDGRRYTVNDDSVNNWTQFVAAQFNRPLAPSAAGGLSYAIRDARVNARPDAAGNAATPTVKEQVEQFLAGNTFGEDDLVIFNAGTADVIAQVQAVLEGWQTREEALAHLAQAGRDLGALVRRAVEGGARHVVVVGPYNLGRSPWSLQTQQGQIMLDGASRFNEQMLVSIVDLGEHVLYVDAALYFNLVSSAPNAYDLSDAEKVVCASVDPGPGIGTGAGQVNSALCTPATIAEGIANYNLHLWADRVYPTPRGHRLFGEYAYHRIKERW